MQNRASERAVNREVVVVVVVVAGGKGLSLPVRACYRPSQTRSSDRLFFLLENTFLPSRPEPQEGHADPERHRAIEVIHTPSALHSKFTQWLPSPVLRHHAARCVSPRSFFSKKKRTILFIDFLSIDLHPNSAIIWEKVDWEITTPRDVFDRKICCAHAQRNQG